MSVARQYREVLRPNDTRVRSQERNAATLRRGPLDDTTARRWRVGRLNVVWRARSWWIEILTILLGYGLYEIVQGAAQSHSRAPFVHASELIRLERTLRIDIEPSVNRFVNAHDWLAFTTGYYYDGLHYLITPAVFAFLYVRRREHYARWRSCLISSSIASLVVFWLWPLAPPRMAMPGIVDIIATRHVLGTVEGTGSGTLVNNYAAMPSLHVGWALWCAAAIVATTSTPWRHLAWLYPAATTFVVLGTGNHYVLDAVGGLFVLGLGMVATTSPAEAHAEPSAKSGTAIGPPIADAQGVIKSTPR